MKITSHEVKFTASVRGVGTVLTLRVRTMYESTPYALADFLLFCC